MRNQDPESTPFFRVALVALGIAGVFAISPMADQLAEHYIKRMEQQKTIEDITVLNKLMTEVDCGHR